MVEKLCQALAARDFRVGGGLGTVWQRFAITVRSAQRLEVYRQVHHDDQL